MDNNEDMNFEEAMAKLDKIAVELESGKLTLEESVSKFEEGMNISKKCSEILDSAEKKITILINNGKEVTEENFKPSEE